MIITALTAVLENAVDLDSGRYVRGGSSSTILYVIRLAIRIGSYIRYLLSGKPIQQRLVVRLSCLFG